MSRPYYDDGIAAIYHGDCREILPALALRADLIVTDPPYGVGYETARRSRTDSLRHKIANDTDLSVFKDAWPVVVGSLRPDRHWYVFASPRKLSEAQEAVGGAKQVLCWDKGDRGTVGDLGAGFGEAWEAILYGMNGRRKLFGSRPRSVIRIDWSSTMDPVHPTVKPVALVGKLLQWSSLPGELVLDAFMGSGPTLRAAKDLGRRAIGIELKEHYCEVAARRLEQNVLDFGGAA